jgi:hypothetical protein
MFLQTAPVHAIPECRERKAFGSRSTRFRDGSEAMENPGPGSYVASRGAEFKDTSLSKKGYGTLISKSRRFDSKIKYTGRLACNSHAGTWLSMFGSAPTDSAHQCSTAQAITASNAGDDIRILCKRMTTERCMHSLWKHDAPLLYARSWTWGLPIPAAPGGHNARRPERRNIRFCDSQGDGTQVKPQSPSCSSQFNASCMHLVVAVQAQPNAGTACWL